MQWFVVKKKCDKMKTIHLAAVEEGCTSKNKHLKSCKKKSFDIGENSACNAGICKVSAIMLALFSNVSAQLKCSIKC